VDHFYLDFKDTFIVSSFRRNLVLVFGMDKLGYLCSFGNFDVCVECIKGKQTKSTRSEAMSFVIPN